jgi:hypothetical protein
MSTMDLAHAPCPLCDRPLVIVEVEPTPAPRRRHVYRTMSAGVEPDVKGVCVHCDLLVDGVLEYVAEGVAERPELEVAIGSAAAARARFQQGDAHGAMRDLARAFPALRSHQEGLEPWDAGALDAWLARAEASEAVLDTAAFVLRVWNASGAWSRRFDAMASLSRWDRVNRAAFIEWARAPWWP